MTEKHKRILITGVSAGIGLGLARECLAQGWEVYGTARHAPDLGKNERFHFVPCDLSKDKEIPAAFRKLLQNVPQLDLAVLNAGVLGPFGDLREQSLEDMQRVMQVNVWANKTILDVLFDLPLKIEQVVGMSSGTSVSGNRGWGGYGISKAALNMLLLLSSKEHPETHFTALAPGLVDTAMQDQLCSEQGDPRYTVLERIKARRGTAEMPDADEFAPRLLKIMVQLPQLLRSGSYQDVRMPPLADL
ncbi:SDR family NAD(P)-dependent oxidoreductase [Planctomicrobium sp. SH664]|uniref:SDR family NAD(P)-dependent oxidoreductase n=1 Tax=Planctomicrobium sp. SH664 TaxID=3448125 RepID=UPI003F5C721E